MLARRWESGNVHIGQQGSVLGLPMDHLKIDEFKQAKKDSNRSNEYKNMIYDFVELLGNVVKIKII